jgi:hypothetical protein
MVLVWRRQLAQVGPRLLQKVGRLEDIADDFETIALELVK